MVRRIAFGLAWFALAMTTSHVLAQGLGSELVPQNIAERFGLHRKWVTSVRLDRKRGQIAHVTQHFGTFYVQTNQAALHAIDEETGRTLWVGHVGERDHPTFAPAANDRYVATAVGSVLYLLDKTDGHIIWERTLDTGPSAGITLTRDRLYIPLVTGVVKSYLLESAKPPYEYPPLDRGQGFFGKGMAESAPIVVGENVIWGTYRGQVYSASRISMQGKFQFRGKSRITAPLAHRNELVYVSSRDGFVYALHGEKGTMRWQFSTGVPVVHQPVVIGDLVYVIPETGGMYQLNAETGVQNWFTRGVESFLASSKDRVYGVDALHRILIIDVPSGARLSMLPAIPMSLNLVNFQTDRIYLASSGGLLQCLHERALKQPIRHVVAPSYAATDAKDAKPDGKQPKADTTKTDAEAEGDADAGAAGDTPDADNPDADNPDEGDAGAEDANADDPLEEDAATEEDPAMEEEPAAEDGAAADINDNAAGDAEPRDANDPFDDSNSAQ